MCSIHRTPVIGLLSNEYIVGRDIRIWKSVDRTTNEFLWERLMNKIRNDEMGFDTK